MQRFKNLAALQLLNSVEAFGRGEKATAHDCLRRIAFSVYAQTRLLIPEHVRGALTPSLTRFGPSSSMSEILDDARSNAVGDSPLYFRVPTAPFILARKSRARV